MFDAGDAKSRLSVTFIAVVQSHSADRAIDDLIRGTGLFYEGKELASVAGRFFLLELTSRFRSHKSPAACVNFGRTMRDELHRNQSVVTRVLALSFYARTEPNPSYDPNDYYGQKKKPEREVGCLSYAPDAKHFRAFEPVVSECARWVRDLCGTDVAALLALFFHPFNFAEENHE